MKSKNLKKEWGLALIIFLLLILITLTTSYYGSTDIASFASPAKYFAGHYQAKIRSSHSYLLGFINFPLVKLFKGFIGFKILNLIVISCLVFSVYYMSKKNKKAFYLMLLSPIVWYMAPWINSIQIASLFFLWNYFFIEKYQKTKKIKFLIYSGIFFGLALAFWHAILFLGFFLILFFFYDKKVLHLFYYLLAILIGLTPLLILDFFLFGFPFHSLIKNAMGTISNHLGWGVYSLITTTKKTTIAYFVFLLFIPFYTWILYKKENFKKNYRVLLFLAISFIPLIINPQSRYLFLLVPIIILNLIKILNPKQIRNLLIISAIISLIIIIPYEIQIKYDTNGEEIRSFLKEFPNISLNKESLEYIINKDLIQISKEFPNEIFLVGNKADEYHKLADIYWGENIQEFISIQDYNLFLQNSSTLVEKEFRFYSKNINGRREFWIKTGIGKPLKDQTDYPSIEYAISLEEDLDAEGFELIEEYKALFLFKKI